MGFSQIVLFTGHFGLEQTLATKRAALRTMQSSDTTIVPLTTYDLVADSYAGDHAGIGETSLMLALRPDLVHLDAWPADTPLPGAIGDDPRGVATAAFGQKILEQSATRAANLIAALKDGRVSREDWMELLDIIVRILENTRSMRQMMPRDQVPDVATVHYMAGWTAIIHGDWNEARNAFTHKAGKSRSGVTGGQWISVHGRRTRVSPADDSAWERRRTHA